MNKKNILIIVSSVLAVCLIFAGVYFALNYKKDTKLFIESKTVMPGDNLSIELSLDDNCGLYYGQLFILYEPKVMEFVSCANGVVFDECEVNDTDGTLVILINQSGLKNSEKDGVLATLNFKVKESAADGEYSIRYSDETVFCNVSDPEKLIKPTLENGVLTVK